MRTVFPGVPIGVEVPLPNRFVGNIEPSRLTRRNGGPDVCPAASGNMAQVAAQVEFSYKRGERWGGGEI